MMPRNPADGNSGLQQQQQQQPLLDQYAQQYGAARPNNANRGGGGGALQYVAAPHGYNNNNNGNLSGVAGQQQQGSTTRRFTISAAGGGGPDGDHNAQQIALHGGGGGMSMGGGEMMGNHSQRSHHSSQQQQPLYRGDMASNSPSNNNPNMSQAYYGAEQLSPTHFAHRMSLGFYPMSGGTAASPNFATIGDSMDLSGRGLPSAAPPAAGAGGPLTQADREEELLLNLLIARRQRGRIAGDGKGRSQASLADDLMRLRQSRAASGQQRSGGIPQMPGMPPLYADSMTAPGGGVGGGGGVPSNMYPGASMDPYQRGASMKAESLSTHHQMRQLQDVSERIDRSPGRFQINDARMSEMREMSERSAAGFKRGMGSMGMGPGGMGMGMPMGYDGTGFNYPSHDMQEMAPPLKKKRTHKKKPADMVGTAASC